MPPSPPRLAFSPVWAVLLAFALGWAAFGCRLGPTVWRGELCSTSSREICPAEEHLAQSRRAQQLATELADAGDERCVDWYFTATHRAWQAAQTEREVTKLTAEATAEYRTGLKRLLCTGQKFGRLDPATGLQAQGITVPVTHCGFPWQADDFQRVFAPSADLPSLLSCRHTRCGSGVPAVVQRCRNNDDPREWRFFPEESSFAATVVLRFAGCDESHGAVLEFHDPLRISKIPSQGGDLPLAADLTAPLVEKVDTTPRTFLSGFLRPGSEEDHSRLNFLEPYQPGKQPVVFIHGLMSDPLIWADMTNDLRALPGFCQRYQIWLFRYPTGEGFLRSATTLRRELAAAVEMCDPEGSDPALRQMVLVGHSMGGLLAKLQVTYSGDTIWRRIARIPLDEVDADERTRARLAGACFFEPSRHVSRVIFIATPHCGSTDASGLAGRIARRIVQEPEEDTVEHQQLIADNPGVFADFLQERLPTSVDLLSPSSPLLAAMREMRIGCGVRLHNIMGVFPNPSLKGPSDGVVPVYSARHPACESELTVRAHHAKIQRTPDTIREVARILAE